MEIKEFEKIIRKIVKEVVELEMMKLRAYLLDYISDEEQKEIESLYKKPSTRVAKKIEIEI